MLSHAHCHSAAQEQGWNMGLDLPVTNTDANCMPSIASKDYNRKTGGMLGNVEKSVQKGILANNSFMR